MMRVDVDKQGIDQEQFFKECTLHGAHRRSKVVQWYNKLLAYTNKH
jgi:hypothetical protein